MINKLKKISIYIAILSLVACGEDFSAGGASLGGTGKPPINPPNIHPGYNHGTEDEFKFLLNPAVEQDCEKLHFKLQFLDTVTQEPFDQLIEVNTDHQVVENNNNMHVRLSVTNKSKDTIYEQQPACYIPISLYKTNDKFRYFPYQESCEEQKQYQYAAHETKVFDVIVNATSITNQESDQYQWVYGEESIFHDSSKNTFTCPALNLRFDIEKVQFNEASIE